MEKKQPIITIRLNVLKCTNRDVTLLKNEKLTYFARDLHFPGVILCLVPCRVCDKPQIKQIPNFQRTSYNQNIKGTWRVTSLRI